jgi:hypothetical protein
MGRWTEKTYKSNEEQILNLGIFVILHNVFLKNNFLSINSQNITLCSLVRKYFSSLVIQLPSLLTIFSEQRPLKFSDHGKYHCCYFCLINLKKQ